MRVKIYYSVTVTLKDFGGKFRLAGTLRELRKGQGVALQECPMMADGTFLQWEDEEDWSEVTAPEDQKFLDAINSTFDTHFELANFAGR